MNTNPHAIDIFALCDVIRETSFDIHRYLRNGHREQIYENALVHRLQKQGISVVQQPEIRVFDEDGTVLGYLKADLIVENQLICEIKGAQSIVDEHIAQLLGYLRASRMEHGMLINFGRSRLEVKKLILSLT
ncbi:MAG TPA: GxxExxY protein [Pyrinomonadaceae bacterium]|nr:GxxExxY protein [Pyrinomonadaceae bacterium]